MAATSGQTLGAFAPGGAASPSAGETMGNFHPSQGAAGETLGNFAQEGTGAQTGAALSLGSNAPTLPINGPPVAPKAKGGGGGGILGDLESVGKGIGGFAANAIEAPIALGEKFQNTITQAAGLPKGFQIGNENPGLNAFARDTSWSKQTAKEALAGLPAVGATEHQFATAGTHAQGASELAAHLFGLGGLVPQGAAKKTAKDYEQHPFQAGLGDVSAALMGAGAVDAAPVDLGPASDAAKTISEAPKSALSAIGSKVSDVAPDSLKDAVARAQAGVGLRSAQMTAGVDPIQIARDNMRALTGVGANPVEEAAGTLRAEGMGPLLQTAVDNPSVVNDQVVKNLLTSKGVPDELQVDAAKEALNPTAGGKTEEYEQALRGIRGSANERYLGGYGDKPGVNLDNRYEQNLPQYRDSVVDHFIAEGKTLAEAHADVASIPTDVRTPVVAARQMLSDFGDQYKTISEAGGNAADLQDIQQVMREIEPLTTPEFWQGKEMPAFLPGNGTPFDAEGNVAAGDQQPTVSKGRFVNTTSTELRSQISTAYDHQGQLELELRSLKQAASNRAVSTILGRVGTSALDVIGDESYGFKPSEIADQMRGTTGPNAPNGYVAIDPYAKNLAGLLVKDADVTPGSIFVPKEYADAMARQYGALPTEGRMGWAIQQGGKALDFATQHGYRDFLAASPHFAILRTVGDAFISSIKGDIPLGDLVSRFQEAAKLVGSGEEPAALSRGIGNVGGLSNPGLNDTTLTDQGGIGAKISQVTQTVPRTIDLMSRTAVFLQKAAEAGVDISDSSTPEYAQAVTQANEAFGALNSLAPAEREVLARIVPAYPWMKSVVSALGGMVADDPAKAIMVMNVGRIAASDPNGFGASGVAQELDPLSIFSLGGGGINPFIRAGVGAATGINLSTGQQVSREGSGHWGPFGSGIDPRQAAYFAANQILPTKALLESPASALLAPLAGGKFGTPLDQNVARYQTGQLKLSKGKTEPAYLPAIHTPVGTYGSYIKELAGTPENPKPTAAGNAAHAKATKTANKTARDYANNLAKLRAKGVQ